VLARFHYNDTIGLLPKCGIGTCCDYSIEELWQKVRGGVVGVFDNFVGKPVRSGCRLEVAVGDGVVDFGRCNGVMFVSEVNWSWLQCWDIISRGERREEGCAENAAFFVKVGMEGVIGLVF
jgi:hypothetical protein